MARHKDWLTGDPVAGGRAKNKEKNTFLGRGLAYRQFRRWPGVIVDTLDTMSSDTGAAESLAPHRRDGSVSWAGTAVGECAYNV